MTDDNEQYSGHVEFQKNLERTVQEYQAEGRDVNTGLAPNQQHPSQRPVPQPNAVLMAQADELQAQKDENGNRLYVTDSQFREKVEAIRRQAYGGDAPAQQPATAPQPATAQETAEPVQGEGTPLERAQREVETSGFVETSSLTPDDFRELCGYDLSDTIPTSDGWGIGDTEIAQLNALRKAGVSESQVKKIVADIVRQQI